MGIQEALTPFEWRQAPAGDFAVIGDPITHTLSPAMHTAAYRSLGLDYRYHAIHVKSGEVSAAMDHLRSLGYRGVNVTVPHKQEVIGWLKDCDAFAVRVQAANTVGMKDRYGFNTDAPAFLETLKLLNVEPGEPALVLGAGGSARAIIAALAEEGYPLRIWNRTRQRAEELVEDLEIEAAVWDAPELLDAKLIVNATSASLSDESVEIEWTHAMPGLIAYDLSYNGSAFFRDAEAHDVRVVDGKGLLVMQGALALEWWLDVEAPRDAMWEAIR